MAVGQSPTIGSQTKWAAGRGTLPAHESAAFAMPTEAQRLQRENHRNRERVVDLADINLCRSEASHSERCLTRGDGGLVRCKVGHVRNRIVRVRFTMPKYPDRGLARTSRSL